MADSELFEQVCGQLERTTTLSRLEVRGTVRLALREAGFDTRSVLADQMAVVLRRLLPGELQKRGIADGERACEAICRTLVAGSPGVAKESPEDIFKRLGGAA